MSNRQEQNGGTEKDRYMVQVELLSALLYDDQKPKGKSDKYYFEVGNRSSRNRTPTHGYFRFGFDTTDEIPTSLTLYSEIIEAKDNRYMELPIFIKERNDDLLKFDDTVAYKKLKIPLGGNSDIHTFKEAGVQMKLAASAIETVL